VDNDGTLPEFMGWLTAWSRTYFTNETLMVAGADVSTGELFPYLKNKKVYLCPEDMAALGSKTGASAPGESSIRPSSFAMNCILCHNNKTARFVTPERTLLFMEIAVPSGILDGLAGPVAGSRNPVFSATQCRWALNILRLSRCASPSGDRTTVGAEQGLLGARSDNRRDQHLIHPVAGGPVKSIQPLKVKAVHGRLGAG
jgi:hypothetical protein